MKQFKLLLAAILCSTVLSSFSQTTILAKVDERVELLSIVFRLAGANEYSKTFVQKYGIEIDNYFSRYKGDDLILFTQKIISKNKVGYDAVMSLALHISIQNGNISLNQHLDNQGIDKRWGTNVDNYISLLNVFYNKSKFSQFYGEHKDLYAATEKKFKKNISHIDFGWYKDFYGEDSKDSFKIVLILAAGESNYGQKIKNLTGQEELYSILCTWETDSLGVPEYDLNEVLPTTIHEYNHSYCNPLIDKYFSQLDNSANKCFKLVKNQMEYQAYGESIIMVYESFVRATSIMYFKNHGTSEKEIKQQIRREQINGFIWSEELVNLLSTYEDERLKYSSLDSYMPNIVEKLNSLDNKKLFSDAHCIGNSAIINCSIQNNANDIDTEIKEIKLYFNTPMSGGLGYNYGKGGKGRYPEVTSVKWNNAEHTELLISIVMKPDKLYHIEFPAKFNLDENYCEMSKSYTLSFKTRK